MFNNGQPLVEVGVGVGGLYPGGKPHPHSLAGTGTSVSGIPEANREHILQWYTIKHA